MNKEEYLFYIIHFVNNLLYHFHPLSSEKSMGIKIDKLIKNNLEDIERIIEKNINDQNTRIDYNCDLCKKEDCYINCDLNNKEIKYLDIMICKNFIMENNDDCRMNIYYKINNDYDSSLFSMGIFKENNHVGDCNNIYYLSEECDDVMFETRKNYKNTHYVLYKNKFYVMVYDDFGNPRDNFKLICENIIKKNRIMC